MHRPRNLLIALLLWAFAAAALFPAWAAASHGQRNYFEASSDLLDPAKRAHVIAQMQALGVSAIRVELYWHDVAPRPNSAAKPKLDATNPASYAWGQYDAVLAEAQRLHWQVLLTLTAPAPRWATSNHKAPYVTRPDPADFEHFMTAVARHYGSQVALYSIWNEPNHPKFWPPAPDAGEFIALLSEVAAALWKQSADASLVTGGLSTIDDRFLSALVPALDSLAKHGSLGLGLHPYRNTPPESVVSDLERVGLLREDGRAATPGGVRVWLTVCGYCRGTRGVGPLHQAEWVPRIPLVGAALDVPLTVLYTLRDNGPQDVAAYTCGFLSAHDEPYPVDDAWTAVSDVAESITSPFRVVPRGVDGTWTIGSCDSALVWPAAPTGVSGSKALTCGQGMSTCPTGIWVVKPATAYWARLGVQCP